MIKSIIFDLDDTIVDSEPLHALSWKILLSQYKHKLSDIPRSIRSKYMGMRVFDISSEIVSYLNIPIDPIFFYQMRTSVFLKLAKERLELLPGINALMLHSLSSKYSLAIASSGTKAYIDLVLEKFKFRDYFDVVITGDDVLKGKPDPETYALAIKKLGVEPLECLVLEDAEKGIESAKSAGCVCVAVASKYTSRRNLSRADMVIDSMNDLSFQLINKW